MAPTSPERQDRGARGWARLGIGWALSLAVLILVRPFDAGDFWWHLARGREVVQGSITPSAQLLTLDHAAEADWLGGVPFYGLWSLAGVQGLAAVPLILAAGLLWRWSRAPSGGAVSPWTPVVAGALLFVLRDGLQPVPAVFDLVGLWTVWRLVAGPSASARPLGIATAFCLWANVATGLVWGLLLILLFPARWNWRLIVAAIVGGSLTPRGVWTWSDAVVLFAPRSFAGPGGDLDPQWSGLLSGHAGGVTTVAWLALWLVWVMVHWRQWGDPVVAARLAVPLLASLMRADHVPLGGLWIALDLLTFPLTITAPSRRWRPVAVAVLSAVALFDAWGCDPVRPRRLGWGVAQAIDPRLLDLDALHIDAAHGTAWAADARSAGVVAWIDAGVRLVDHPQRALLEGRWPEHALLRADLRGAHRAAYRRDDGQWGGIVQQLQAWQVSLLFLPMEDVPLNRSLIGTPWRPVDLDSPTVPYASTDDAYFARTVLEIEQQEAFVEAGAWQPSLDAYAGHGWRFDVVELLGGGPDPGPAIRQSQLFRGRDIPSASLRALLPVRARTSSRALQQEFQRCHEHLAYQEWVTFGGTNAFRTLVVHALGNTDESAPWLRVAATSDHGDVPVTLRDVCVPRYLQGDVRGALDGLTTASDEERYAAAMLSLEIGDIDRARTELTALRSSTSGTLKAAAEFWTGLMESFHRRATP